MEQFNVKKSIKRNYQIRSLVTLIVFVFLFSSNYIFGVYKDKEPLKTGVQLEQADTTVTYIKSDYDNNNREFVFAFSLDLSTVNPLYEYSVSAKADKKTSDDLPVEIKKISEDKYLAFIKELPTKWKKMSVTVVAKKENELLQNSSGNFLFERAWYEDSSKSLNKNADDYLPYFVEVKVETIEKEIKENDKVMKELENQNKKLKESIKQFKASKEVAVGEELEQLDSQIASSESTIKSNEEQIKQYQELNKNNKEKIELISNKGN